MIFLGLETSNYACSGALYDRDSREILANIRFDLPVREGALGLRQSDAVFEQVRLLPAVFDKLREYPLASVKAAAVSAAPTGAVGSYMPCFLSGVSAAEAFALGAGIPLYRTDHQTGHVLAAVHGCKAYELYSKSFYAVHLSGGTTDIVRCDCTQPVPKLERVAGSADLHAGQCVDRVGKLLGMPFPAGQALSAAAALCADPIRPKASRAAGGCSLSGLQNRCEALWSAGESRERVARFCLESIAESVFRLVQEHCAGLPVVMSGGVSSSEIIRDYLIKRDRRFLFSDPVLCRDNAVGVAICASRLYSEG